MKKLSAVSLAMLVFLGAVIHEAVAWENEVAHTDLTIYATEKSAIGGSNGILNKIGLDKGVDKYLIWGNKSKKIIDWLREGAKLEDETIVRSYNHFHNPLKPWSEAGLSSMKGQSAVVWGQENVQQFTNNEGQVYVFDTWSWKTVRDYYYRALTEYHDSARQEYYARTFRGLGQQMHLLQDMSQPDHVRNDAHIIDAGLGGNDSNGGLYFESWAKREYRDIGLLAQSPITPVISLSTPLNGLAPIARLFDTDQYAGMNPSDFVSQGLAEYTSSNFFSDHTKFAEEKATDDPKYFPYPRKSSTNLESYENQGVLPETVPAEDGKPDTGFWISKTGDGEKIGHFLKPSYVSDIVKSYMGDSPLYRKTFYRDEACHKDYASLLIPRAVGYSADLLNYFFRGSVELVAADQASSGYAISNLSSEKMSGLFEIFYDTQTGERKSLWSGAKEIDGGAQAGGVQFTLTDEAKGAARYMLVFKGKMGGEDDSVFGTVVSIPEPKNDTDDKDQPWNKCAITFEQALSEEKGKELSMSSESTQTAPAEDSSYDNSEKYDSREWRYVLTDEQLCISKPVLWPYGLCSAYYDRPVCYKKKDVENNKHWSWVYYIYPDQICYHEASGSQLPDTQVLCATYIDSLKKLESFVKCFNSVNPYFKKYYWIETKTSSGSTSKTSYSSTDKREYSIKGQTKGDKGWQITSMYQETHEETYPTVTWSSSFFCDLVDYPGGQSRPGYPIQHSGSDSYGGSGYSSSYSYTLIRNCDAGAYTEDIAYNYSDSRER